MCLATPGQIISIEPDQKNGLVSFQGLKKRVNLSLVKVKKGDWVVVHAGFAIQKLIQKDAQQVFQMLKRNRKISQSAQSRS